ncbi:MAG: DedA family protein [Candidatus Komeilibacteria bacterium]
MDWQLFLQTYGYWAFYFLLVVEGQPTYWLGGIFLSLGVFNFWALLLGPVFVLLGDYLFYLLGYHLGSKVVRRIGKYIFLPPERIDYLQKKFLSHKGKMIILSKFAYGIGHNLMLVYGISRGNFKDTWKWNLLGGTGSYIIYVTFGYYLGHYAKKLVNGSSLVILVVAIIVIFGSQIVYRRWREHIVNIKAKKNENLQPS